MKHYTNIFIFIISFIIFSSAIVIGGQTASAYTVFTIGKLGPVCSHFNSPSCYTTASANFNVSKDGTYSVVGNVERGNVNECQAHEDFDLYIDGKFYVASFDPNSCEKPAYKNETYPKLALTIGSHKILMVHRWIYKPPTGTAESVALMSLTFSLPNPPKPKPKKPICSMRVSPKIINSGKSATLSWNSTYAGKKRFIDNGVGRVNKKGSKSVSPNTTTTYTGTFKGAGGTTYCSAVLKVKTVSSPDISIVLDDNDNHDDHQTVASGGVADFSVIVKNTGNSRLIDVAVIDALAPNCNKSFSQTSGLYPGLTFDPGESFFYICSDPNVTASYTNSAKVKANEIGTSVVVDDTDTTNVSVGGLGVSTVCSMKFNPSSIKVGDKAVLSWNSTNALTASIDQGVGTVNTSGTKDIFRTSTATYTGTFKGSNKTVTCSATIMVGGGGGVTHDPKIILSSELYAKKPAFIYLSQVPYTGVPEFLISSLGYLFRFFFFGGLLFTLYKVK